MGIDMPHGNVLRIEPVRSKRDDAHFECVADNGIGEPATASASLEIYPEGEGKLNELKIKLHPEYIEDMTTNTFNQHIYNNKNYCLEIFKNIKSQHLHNL